MRRGRGRDGAARGCSARHRSGAFDRDAADLWMSVQSRHSILIVSITLSAWALAFGAWIGVRMTRIPSERSTVSNDRLYLVSRSRMTNRMAGEWPSRSMTGLRACWVTHAEFG